ncbi:hypothetical protein SAMN04487939_103248 [Lysobacter sp. yr284]|nr:hypothetical protein SAMN04487939_103248 [Lysobacter sp. yr284]
MGFLGGLGPGRCGVSVVRPDLGGFDEVVDRLGLLGQGFLRGGRIGLPAPVLYPARLLLFFDRGHGEVLAGLRGGLDLGVGLRVLGAAVVVGVVLFRSGAGLASFLFGGLFGAAAVAVVDRGLRGVGALAFRRWLGAFCVGRGGVVGGVVLLLAFALWRAVVGVGWGFSAGLCGLVLAVAVVLSRRSVGAVFDRLCAVCVGLGLGVLSPGVFARPVYGRAVGSLRLLMLALGFFLGGVLAGLVFGGVFVGVRCVGLVSFAVGLVCVAAFFGLFAPVSAPDWVRLGLGPKVWLLLSLLGAWGRPFAAGATAGPFGAFEAVGWLGFGALLWVSAYWPVGVGWRRCWAVMGAGFATVGASGWWMLVGACGALFCRLVLPLVGSLVAKLGRRFGAFVRGGGARRAGLSVASLAAGLVSPSVGLSRWVRWWLASPARSPSSRGAGARGWSCRPRWCPGAAGFGRRCGLGPGVVPACASSLVAVAGARGSRSGRGAVRVLLLPLLALRALAWALEPRLRSVWVGVRWSALPACSRVGGFSAWSLAGLVSGARCGFAGVCVSAPPPWACGLLSGRRLLGGLLSRRRWAVAVSWLPVGWRLPRAWRRVLVAAACGLLAWLGGVGIFGCLPVCAPFCGASCSGVAAVAVRAWSSASPAVIFTVWWACWALVWTGACVALPLVRLLRRRLLGPRRRMWVPGIGWLRTWAFCGRRASWSCLLSSPCLRFCRRLLSPFWAFSWRCWPDGAACRAWFLSLLAVGGRAAAACCSSWGRVCSF